MRVFREAFDYDFSRLDPTAAHIDPPSIAVYESLLAKGPDRASHPYLARVVDISESRLDWTLQIRSGARFHSGEICDSAAVVESLAALRMMHGDSRQLWYWDPVDTVVPLDDQTIRFRLHYPYRRLPSLLWGTHTAIFNRAAQLRDPVEFGSSIADGTGPYRLVSLDPSRLVAERLTSYPTIDIPGTRTDPGSLDRIEWLSIPDPAQRLAALLAGEVHALHGAPYSELAALQENPAFRFYEAGQASSMYLSLNWERTELGFDDVRVRRAISRAIDRVSLVKRALEGHGSPTWGPLPPGTEYYDPRIDAAGSCDASRAERELDELGWLRGSDGVRTRAGQRMSFECVIQRSSDFEAVASVLTQQLGAIGVELLVSPAEPFAPFYEACAAGPASSISKWLWPDPVDALIGFASTATAPFPNWSNASVPQLDNAFERWLRAESDEDLVKASSDAQHIFAETLPYLPLLSPNDVWAWRADVLGFAPSPHILYPLYQGVDLAREGAPVSQ